ncbi:MAG: hypothetical protein K6C07_01980 [Bacteroidales bacterium]|nr:hypothetical protein [Bacteroidales bacterium]
MRRNVIIWTFFAVLFLLGCNKPIDCKYTTGIDIMEYDPVTKECDCVNNNPLLTLDTGYNTWNDFKRYMVFYYRADKPYLYPYYSREGDTVRVCGWIAHDGSLSVAEDIEDSTLIQFDILDDSLSAMNAGRLTSICHIEGKKELLENIDHERKCYITGTITFNPRPHPDLPFYAHPNEPWRDCVSASFSVRMIEIKN